MSYKDQLMTWDREIEDSQAHHGEEIDDDVNRMLIMAQGPEAFEQHMAIFANSLPIYQSMREQVMNERFEQEGLSQEGR